MKAEHFPSWAVLGLALLFTAHALIAVENYDVTLTEKTLLGAEKKFGPSAPLRLLAWTKLIADSKRKPVAEKLELTNDFFNRLPVKSSRKFGGKLNYWPTPAEMLARNESSHAGLAVGKYFTLLALGVSIDQLQITYVNASTLPAEEQPHMVLTFYSKPDAMPLVLDNLDRKIKPANERNDLIPIYSFNGDGLWLAKERSSGRSEASGHIDLWNEMNARMGKEFLSPEEEEASKAARLNLLRKEP